jgi:hypothetical protein
MIHEAITAERSFDASVQRMSGERARTIAEAIWDLALGVAVREHDQGE